MQLSCKPPVYHTVCKYSTYTTLGIYMDMNRGWVFFHQDSCAHVLNACLFYLLLWNSLLFPFHYCLMATQHKTLSKHFLSACKHCQTISIRLRIVNGIAYMSCHVMCTEVSHFQNMSIKATKNKTGYILQKKLQGSALKCICPVFLVYLIPVYLHWKSTFICQMY